MARRSVVGWVVATALVVTGLGQVPAMAEEPWPAPVLLSPMSGDVVGATVELTATSDAPFVLFEFRRSTPVRRVPVAVGEDGIFRDTLPAVGMSESFSARVLACSDASVESCATPGPYVTVTHPLPFMAGARDGPVDPNRVPSITLTATDLGGYPATLSGVPGRATSTIHDGEAIVIDLEALPDRRSILTLKQCNPLVPTACTTWYGEVWIERVRPILTLPEATLFLSQNGDGLWETAASRVQLDWTLPVNARWRIVSAAGATVAGPYEFTQGEIDKGRIIGGVDIVIDPKKRLGRPLPAGHYRFEVDSARVVDAVASTQASQPLVVSNAAPVTALKASVSVVRPDDDYRAGRETVVAFTPRLDPLEVEFGPVEYRFIWYDGKPFGGGTIDPRDPVIRWRTSGLPRGVYHVELVRYPHRDPRTGELGAPVHGPRSGPIRSIREWMGTWIKNHVRTADSTMVRAVAERGVRLVVGDTGSLRYKPRPGGQAERRLTTVHEVRLPAERYKKEDSTMLLRGRWGRVPNIEIAVILPGGRRLPFDGFSNGRRRDQSFRIDERWVDSSGRFRFKVRWAGRQPRRMDHVILQVPTPSDRARPVPRTAAP